MAMLPARLPPPLSFDQIFCRNIPHFQITPLHKAHHVESDEYGMDMTRRLGHIHTMPI